MKSRGLSYGLLACFAWLLVVPLLGQSKATTDLPEMRRQQMYERMRYDRSSRPPEPSNAYLDPPYYDRDISEVYINDWEVSESDIQRSREKRFPTRGNNGVRQRMAKGELPEIQDLTTPDVEIPDIQPVDVVDPRIDGDVVSSEFWKILLIIIAIVVISLVAYALFSGGTEQPKRRVYNQLDDNADWDPREIEIDELTKKLNEALSKGDYRAGVRVYYTLILKELVDKGWIEWQKKKTNYHYISELAAKPQRPHFERCVTLFEMVWYGKYNLNQEQFREVEPKFKALYSILRNG